MQFKTNNFTRLEETSFWSLSRQFCHVQLKETPTLHKLKKVHVWWMKLLHAAYFFIIAFHPCLKLKKCQDKFKENIKYRLFSAPSPSSPQLPLPLDPDETVSIEGTMLDFSTWIVLTLLSLFPPLFSKAPLLPPLPLLPCLCHRLCKAAQQNVTNWSSSDAGQAWHWVPT